MSKGKAKAYLIEHETTKKVFIVLCCVVAGLTTHFYCNFLGTPSTAALLPTSLAVTVVWWSLVNSLRSKNGKSRGG